MSTMSDLQVTQIVGEDIHLTFVELCRAVRVPEQQLHAWVVEGVLEPIGTAPQEWRFAGASLRRARIAVTLTRELEINNAGVALALDLMDEIDALKARLRTGGLDKS